MQTVNLCTACARYHRNAGPSGEGATCDAFPDGIPNPIFFGQFDHRREYGDEALTFELLEGFESAVAAFEKRARHAGVALVTDSE